MKQSISNGLNFNHQEGTVTSHAIASLVSIQIWLQQSLAWNISTNVQLKWNTSAERLDGSESSDKILPSSWTPHPLKVQLLASAGIAPSCSVYNAIKWSILTMSGNPSLLAVKNKSVLRYYEQSNQRVWDCGESTLSRFRLPQPMWTNQQGISCWSWSWDP